MQVALVALGANIPWEGTAPSGTLRRAIEALDAGGDAVSATSRLYRTPCFPAGAGPDYCNAAVMVRTPRTAAEFLGRLAGLEDRFGRQREKRWGNRTLDLDLLAVGDEIAPDRATFDAWAGMPLEEQARRTPRELVLPHPRIQDRAFVLVPLAEISPDWRHPVFGRTASEMLAALPGADRDAVIPL